MEGLYIAWSISSTTEKPQGKNRFKLRIAPLRKKTLRAGLVVNYMDRGAEESEEEEEEEEKEEKEKSEGDVTEKESDEDLLFEDEHVQALMKLGKKERKRKKGGRNNTKRKRMVKVVNNRKKGKGGKKKQKSAREDEDQVE